MRAPSVQADAAGVLPIDHRQHFLLPTGTGRQVTCISGLIWITQQGNLQDWLLRPGESAQFTGPPILVGAIDTARLRIAPVNLAGVRRVSTVRAVAALLMRRLLRRSARSVELSL